jgi:succinyl-CoA synthetase alpha subunit
VLQLTQIGLGQTTAVGIGGDPVHGFDFIEVLRLFEADPATEGVIMIGEIGGTEEARGAEWVKANMTKPVVGFIAGRTAPPGKRMGHAGAVISGGGDTAEAKMAIMRDAGILVCESPSTLGQGMKDLLAGRKPKGQEVPRAAPKAAGRVETKAPAKVAAKPAPKATRNGKGAPKGAARGAKKTSKR